MTTQHAPAPLPAAHAAHATVDEAVYVPELHAVHVVAPLLATPVPAPTSVIEPAAHVAHATVDEAVYVPEPHAVHVVAPLLTTPVPAPVSYTHLTLPTILLV